MTQFERSKYTVSPTTNGAKRIKSGENTIKHIANTIKIWRGSPLLCIIIPPFKIDSYYCIRLQSVIGFDTWEVLCELLNQSCLVSESIIGFSIFISLYCLPITELLIPILTAFSITINKTNIPMMNIMRIST